MQTITKFAEEHRLHIRRDECGDQIIPGRRGFLYFDEGKLCLMVTDGKPAIRSRWEKLGGKLWMGDISPSGKGVRVQDVKVEGITNAKAAIALAGVKRMKQFSEEQLAAKRELMKSLHARQAEHKTGKD